MKNPNLAQAFWLKFLAQASAFLAALSVVGASFVVLKLSLQALTFLLDLALEPSNPRLFVPAP